MYLKWGQYTSAMVALNEGSGWGVTSLTTERRLNNFDLLKIVIEQPYEAYDSTYADFQQFYNIDFAVYLDDNTLIYVGRVSEEGVRFVGGEGEQDRIEIETESFLAALGDRKEERDIGFDGIVSSRAGGNITSDSLNERDNEALEDYWIKLKGDPQSTRVYSKRGYTYIVADTQLIVPYGTDYEDQVVTMYKTNVNATADAMFFFPVNLPPGATIVSAKLGMTIKHIYPETFKVEVKTLPHGAINSFDYYSQILTVTADATSSWTFTVPAGDVNSIYTSQQYPHANLATQIQTIIDDDTYNRNKIVPIYLDVHTDTDGGTIDNVNNIKIRYNRLAEPAGGVPEWAYHQEGKNPPPDGVYLMIQYTHPKADSYYKITDYDFASKTITATSPDLPDIADPPSVGDSFRLTPPYYKIISGAINQLPIKLSANSGFHAINPSSGHNIEKCPFPIDVRMGESVLDKIIQMPAFEQKYDVGRLDIGTAVDAGDWTAGAGFSTPTAILWKDKWTDGVDIPMLRTFGSCYKMLGTSITSPKFAREFTATTSGSVEWEFMLLHEETPNDATGILTIVLDTAAGPSLAFMAFTYDATTDQYSVAYNNAAGAPQTFGYYGRYDWHTLKITWTGTNVFSMWFDGAQIVDEDTYAAIVGSVDTLQWQLFTTTSNSHMYVRGLKINDEDANMLDWEASGGKSWQCYTRYNSTQPGSATADGCHFELVHSPTKYTTELTRSNVLRYNILARPPIEKLALAGNGERRLYGEYGGNARISKWNRTEVVQDPELLSVDEMDLRFRGLSYKIGKVRAEVDIEVDISIHGEALTVGSWLEMTLGPWITSTPFVVMGALYVQNFPGGVERKLLRLGLMT